MCVNTRRGGQDGGSARCLLILFPFGIGRAVTRKGNTVEFPYTTWRRCSSVLASGRFQATALLCTPRIARVSPTFPASLKWKGFQIYNTTDFRVSFTSIEFSPPLPFLPSTMHRRKNCPLSLALSPRTEDEYAVQSHWTSRPGTEVLRRSAVRFPVELPSGARREIDLPRHRR